MLAFVACLSNEVLVNECSTFLVGDTTGLKEGTLWFSSVAVCEVYTHHFLSMSLTCVIPAVEVIIVLFTPRACEKDRCDNENASIIYIGKRS